MVTVSVTAVTRARKDDVPTVLPSAVNPWSVTLHAFTIGGVTELPTLQALAAHGFVMVTRGGRFWGGCYDPRKDT